MKKKPGKQDGKKLQVKVTTIRKLQENLNKDQLKVVVGGMGCDASASGTRAQC